MLNRPSHRHPRRHTTRLAPTNAPLDLDLIAQRVLKLAEIATLEHLEALLNSQADGLLTLTGTVGEGCETNPRVAAAPQIRARL